VRGRISGQRLRVAGSSMHHGRRCARRRTRLPEWAAHCVGFDQDGRGSASGGPPDRRRRVRCGPLATAARRPV